MADADERAGVVLIAMSARSTDDGEVCDRRPHGLEALVALSTVVSTASSCVPVLPS